MDIKEFFNESEKPLEHLVSDGGFTKIFRTIGCIGDSLSSGEFESCDKDGKKGYHDMYEYSWGQFIARTCGSTVYNFSRGGMCSDWFMTDAPKWGWFDYAKRAQAYIFALGVNDLYGKKLPVGTPDDRIDDNTFAGWYIEIIRRYKEIQPQAKFFLMTMVHTGDKDTDAVADAHAELLYKIAEKFDNTYVIDLCKYGPVYDDFFKSKFYLHGHLNPMGYELTARMVMSYIDYIIRHNMSDFKRTGLIGTGIEDVD